MYIVRRYYFRVCDKRQKRQLPHGFFPYFGRVKRIIGVFLIWGVVATAAAQNLIPNPGFEAQQGGKSLYWTQPLHDYNHFYQCAALESCPAHSGEGYHALCMYLNEPNEFMHVRLSQKLEAGKRYRAGMYVRISNSSDPFMRNDNPRELQAIHWYFSDYPIDVRYKLFLYVTPQLVFRIDHSKDRNWSYYEITFTAQGGEEYLTIGNFTNVAQQLAMDEELGALKDSIAELQREKEQAAALIREEYRTKVIPLGEQPSVTAGDLSILHGGKSPKVNKKQVKKWNEIQRKNSVLQQEMSARVRETEKKYDQGISRLEYRYETRKNRFSVNYCFDDLSLVEAGKGEVLAHNPFEEQPEEGALITLRNIYFETAKYELLQASFTELDQLYGWMQRYPDLRVRICGHTDAQGNAEANEILSGNRAGAVYSYLKEKGINPERMRYNGFGSRYPVADNATEKSRALNRRVELIVE